MAPAMSQGMVQQMRQRQEMALTQQMLQSMEILQLQQMDLEQRLDEEVNQNPALERDEFVDRASGESPVDNDPEIDARYDRTSEAYDPDDSGFGRGVEDGRASRVEADEYLPDTPPSGDASPFDSYAESSGVGDGGGDDLGATGAGGSSEGDSYAHIDDIDSNADPESWYDDDVYSPRRERGAPGSGGGGDDEYFDPVLQLPARGPSYTDYLEGQLGEEDITPRRRALARGIIAKLDGDGWLRVPLAQTPPDGLAPPPDEDELEAALATVQRLDPPGTGARDLRECLALQIDRRADEDPGGVAAALVRGELENLAANRLPLIAKRLERTLDEVKAAAALIRGCRPKPGADFDAPRASAVRPDVRIIQTGGDEGAFGLRVELPGGAPRVGVSDFWMALFDRTARARILAERFLADPVEGASFRAMREKIKSDPEAARNYRELYDKASGLMKAVGMRDQTLMRVTEAIVEAQGAYLRGESDAPAPLLMQEIARRVGYDESTISRAVKDKYADTPRGIVPLRDFFVRSAAATPTAEAAARRGGRRVAALSAESTEAGEGGGDGLSSQHVINRIRDMIAGEDKKKPLRDNELLDRLADEGFHLARRTVANYRAQLGYPSHTKRREY